MIVTHSGQFHADEVFACALLLEVVGEMPITRTRDILEYPGAWILDVGGVYDPDTNKFDHHQDQNLDATNMLILEYLYNKNLIDVSMFNRLLPPFSIISHIDLNGYDDYDGFQINSLINSYNRLENGFDIAITTARSFIKAQFISHALAEKSKAIYEAGIKISYATRVCNEFPTAWKSYKDCVFLVAPSEDKWAIHSIDGVHYPIIPMGNEVFIHNKKFIAVYATKDEAVASAKKQAINTFS